jgi:hypothetical protein
MRCRGPFGAADSGAPSDADGGMESCRPPGGMGGDFGGMGGGMGEGWMSTLDEAGCGAGVNIVEMGGPNVRNPTVGSGGGYGGFYCFAMKP